MQTPQGWVLVTGCAHPGIAEMAARATEVVGEPLHLVLGGFHMGGAPPARIRAVIDRFQALGVERAAPCHCSGDETRELFRERFGERYVPACVGTRLAFSGREGQVTAR